MKKALFLSVIALFFGLTAPTYAQIGGSGTAGKIPKFTGPTTIGNSIITEAATGRIGIGTANPQEVLDVIGGAFFRGNSTRAMFAANQNGTGDIAAFLQGGVYKVVITNTGNVGIGTVSPSAPLQVSRPDGSNSGDYTAKIVNLDVTDNQGQGLLIQAGNGVNDSPLRIQNRAGTNLVSVRADGNVGIGTAAPGGTLDIRSTTNPTPNILLVSSGGVGLNIQNVGTSYMGISTVSAHPLVLGTVGFERVRIDTAGNVGIGTAVPNHFGDSLDRVLTIEQTVNGNRAAGLELIGKDDQAGDFNPMGLISFGHNDAGTFRRLGMIYVERPSGGATSDSEMRFKTALGGVLNSAMMIDKNGNVGIGTTNPSSPLTVYKQSAGEIKVDAGSGYYSLLGINYLDTNGPGNPFYIRMAGTNKVTVLENGNVGIGTNPGQKLSVAGTVESISGGFKFPDGSIQSTAAGSGVWATSGADIYNTNTGNVGIGTTAPNKPLHVKGINALARFESTAASSLIYFTPSEQKEWSIGAGSINVGDFGIHNTTDGIEALNITAAGNVGIGTAAPTQKLDVAGGLRVEGLANCNTIDTDVSGNLFCGTDETGGGGGGGVTSLNGATGAMSIVGGGSATIATNGNTITVSTPACTPFNSPIACNSPSNSCYADCPTGYIIVNWSCGGTANPTISGNRGSCTGSFGPVQGAGNCQKSC